MLQEEFLNDLRDFTIRIKERLVRNRPMDLLPFAVIYRGDTRVARITMGDAVETNLKTLSIAANLMGGDQLGFVSEGYQADGQYADNPMTGKEWERGEISEAVRKHDALGQGWVRETITIFAINRADDLASVSLPFRYVGGKHISWQDSDTWNTFNMPEDVQVAGLVPQMLREAMAQAWTVSVMGYVPPDVPTGQRERDEFAAELLTKANRAVRVELF